MVNHLQKSAARLVSIAALGIIVALPAWAADGTWSAVAASGPSSRESSAAVYDATNHRYIVFGGLFKDYVGDYTLFNELWMLSLDGTPAWTHTTIDGASPGPRHSPQWTYDAANNRVFVFGGYGEHYPGDAYAYLNDVWVLTLNGTPAWTELTPVGIPPSGRLAGAAIYDPLRQRFIGFGGTVNLPVDTWSLELAPGQPRWMELRTGGTSPPGGYGMTAVYDAARDRMLIFGGSTSDSYYGVRNDVWALNLSGLPSRDSTQISGDWEHLAPSGVAPVARRSGTAIYDPLRDRMVLFGGWDSTENGLASFYNDVWALTFDPSPAWTQLQPDGTLPPGRDGMPSAYDPDHDRMVVFGGWSGAADLADAQMLDWSGQGTAASLAGVAQAPQPTTAQVTFSVANATGPYAGIYRRTTTSDWSSIGTAVVDNAGVISFQDNTVSSGTQYGYMAVVGSQRGNTFGGEAWVNTGTTAVPGPGPSALALSRVTPDPAVGRFVVGFTLPKVEAASLALLDVAGRSVASRQVGALGVGTHTVAFGEQRRIAPGLYFLKLTQAGKSVSERVVVVE